MTQKRVGSTQKIRLIGATQKYRQGDMVILIPMKDRYDALTEAVSKFTDDFMKEREQPEYDVRSL